jgi:O-antigen/teichoic acid export membrane protein
MVYVAAPMISFLKGLTKSAGSATTIQLFRHASVYLIGDLLVRAGSLVLVPVYTRSLPLEDYGSLAVATLIGSVVSFLTGMSLSAAVIKLGPEFSTSAHPQHVADNITKFVFIWSALMGGLLLMIVPSATVLFFNAEKLASYNRMAVVTGCFTGITTTLVAVFQSNHEPVKYRLVTLCTFAANVATGLVAVLLLNLGGFGAVLGQLVGAGCGCVVAVCTAGINLAAPLDRPLIGRAIGIGIPLTIYSIGGFSTDQLSRIFIERYVSAAALGPYNIAALYSTSSLGLIFSAINTAWVPKFFQLTREKSREQSSHYGTAIIIGALCLGGLLVVIAPIVIRLLVGRDYWGAVEFVPLLMFNAIVAGPLWSLFMNPLVLAGRNWSIAWCAVASGACNMVLNVMLTPRFGVWGAAVSSMFSLCMLTAMVAMISIRVFPVNYGMRAIVETGALVAIACIGAIVADRLLGYSLAIHLILAVVCAAFSYWVLHRQWLKARRHLEAAAAVPANARESRTELNDDAAEN